MQVEVRLFCGLESSVTGVRFGEPIIVEITENLSGAMLLDKLNVPKDKVTSFLVNGVHKDLKDIICDGDRVSVFPPVGGG